MSVMNLRKMDITIPRIIKNWRFSPNIEFTKNFEENKVSQ